MDYARLLKDSWRITWRHKYLWILGLLAGEAGGCNFSFGTGDLDSASLQGRFPTYDAGGLERWLDAHLLLIVVLALGLLVLGVVFLVISLIAKAGLIAGVDDIALARRDAGLGRAWGSGARRFGGLLVMYLLVGLAAALALIVAGALVAIPILSWITTGAEPGVGGILVLVLIILVLVVLAIPAGVAVQLVLTWGARSYVLDRTGAVDSLRAGWRLLRARLGVSLLLYLLTIAVGMGVGLIMALMLVVIVLPIALGVIAGGGGTVTWIAIGAAALVAIAASMAISAIAGTFFSTYWTLAYRRLFPPPSAPAFDAPWSTGPVGVHGLVDHHAVDAGDRGPAPI